MKRRPDGDSRGAGAARLPPKRRPFATASMQRGSQLYTGAISASLIERLLAFPPLRPVSGKRMTGLGRVRPWSGAEGLASPAQWPRSREHLIAAGGRGQEADLNSLHPAYRGRGNIAPPAPSTPPRRQPSRAASTRNLRVPQSGVCEIPGGFHRRRKDHDAEINPNLRWLLTVSPCCPWPPRRRRIMYCATMRPSRAALGLRYAEEQLRTVSDYFPLLTSG